MVVLLRKYPVVLMLRKAFCLISAEESLPLYKFRGKLLGVLLLKIVSFCICPEESIMLYWF